MADAAVRDTLELLLGILDHCKQDSQLWEPALRGPAVPTMVSCARSLRDLYGGLQFKLLGCALDLAMAASSSPNAALAQWPGLEDVVLDWIGGGRRLRGGAAAGLLGCTGLLLVPAWAPRALSPCSLQLA